MGKGGLGPVFKMRYVLWQCKIHFLPIFFISPLSIRINANISTVCDCSELPTQFAVVNSKIKIIRRQIINVLKRFYLSVLNVENIKRLQELFSIVYVFLLISYAWLIAKTVFVLFLLEKTTLFFHFTPSSRSFLSFWLVSSISPYHDYFFLFFK